MASNKKMQENKPTLKFNFTQEYMRPDLILSIFCSDGPIQRALLYKWSRVRWQMRDSENWATDGVSVAIGPWLLSIAQSWFKWVCLCWRTSLYRWHFFPLKTSSFIASKRCTYTKPVLSKLNIISMHANCKDSIKCKFAKKKRRGEVGRQWHLPVVMFI